MSFTIGHFYYRMGHYKARPGPFRGDSEEIPGRGRVGRKDEAPHENLPRKDRQGRKKAEGKRRKGSEK